MKRLIAFHIVFLSALAACQGQGDSMHETAYSREFNWSITIPEKFVAIGDRSSQRTRSLAAEVMTNAYPGEVDDGPTTVLLFKNGDFNYLEATYEVFDHDDGPYEEACKEDREILFETLRTQMSMAKVDSVSYRQTISGLEFRVFQISVVFPNGMKWQSFTYNRLFGDRDFFVNIVYVDEEPGRMMMEAWLASSFR